MTEFWSLAAGMTIAALLFVLPALLRTHKTPTVTRDDLNTKVIKEQLAELDTDLAVGKLDQSQFDAAHKDLERELLYDLDSGDSGQAGNKVRNGRWITLLIIPAFPLCAVLLYQQLGSVELIDTLQLTKASQADPHSQQSARSDSLDALAERLAEHLRSKPDDLQGWVMMAKTYSVLGRPDEAVRAYENILRLGDATSPDILADYADVLITANDGQFNDRSGELLQQALKLQPNHVKALWLAGHWEYSRQKYAEALQHWQMAAQQLPSGSDDATVIAQQISMLQDQLGTGNSAANTKIVDDTQPNESATRVSLKVHVELDPALHASTAPEDTVFIFARATQGPRMPLAIVRKQVKDLPITVTLDDSLAMSPQMVLSMFEQVTIGARISKTGNAMSLSGDMEGFASPVTTQTTEEIQIIINNPVF